MVPHCCESVAVAAVRLAVHRLDWLTSCEREESSLLQLRETKLLTSVASTEAPEWHLVS